MKNAGICDADLGPRCGDRAAAIKRASGCRSNPSELSKLAALIATLSRLTIVFHKSPEFMNEDSKPSVRQMTNAAYKGKTLTSARL